jgi:transposase-like protein
MGKSSSFDLRVRIVEEIERGHSCRSAARRFGVSCSATFWMRVWRQSG